MNLDIRYLRQSPVHTKWRQNIHLVWAIFFLIGLLAFLPEGAAAEVTEIKSPAAEGSLGEVPAEGMLKEKLRKAREASNHGENAPSTKATTPFQSNFSRSAKASLYFIIVICFGLAVFKKLNNKQQAPLAPDLIKVLGRQALGSKTVLLVVEADGKKFFLSQNGEEVSLLADLSPNFDDTFGHLATEDSFRVAVNNS